jgi:hypothetical protein
VVDTDYTRCRRLVLIIAKVGIVVPSGYARSASGRSHSAILPVSLPPKLCVRTAETEHLPFYLRIFFRVLSSWVHGIYQRKRRPQEIEEESADAIRGHGGGVDVGGTSAPRASLTRRSTEGWSADGQGRGRCCPPGL